MGTSKMFAGVMGKNVRQTYHYIIDKSQKRCEVYTKNEL